MDKIQEEDNTEYLIYLNDKVIGNISIIEIFEEQIKHEFICLCFDGGDGPSVVVEIKKEFITFDCEKKEIHLKG